MNSTSNDILNVYKPLGPSSFQAVQQVKHILKTKKAGHIGTLDPMAEGVLPICLNRSTRIVQFLTHLPKTYLATMTLGVETDTQDATGQIISKSSPTHITSQDIKKVFEGFLGEQDQMPPMFSAKKKNGVPLYKLARNGITVKRKAARIEIFSLEFIDKCDDTVTFRVHCSSGTYIRTLCHDVGKALNCGGHMKTLVRERVGSFNLDSALTFDDIAQSQDNDSLDQKLIRPEKALEFLPEIQLKKSRANALLNGIAPSKSSLEFIPEPIRPGMNFRVTDKLLGLVAIVEPLTDLAGLSDLPDDIAAFKLIRVLA